MHNSIIDFLNLKEEEIETLETHSTPAELIVHLSLRKQAHPCPKCKIKTSMVKNTYTRTINHGLFISRKCTVLYKQKRYYCPLCQSSFIEPNTLVNKHQKKSLASVYHVMELLKSPHMTFKKVGELLQLSTTTILDIFVGHCPDTKKTLPRVLCIDEVYLGRNATKKYVALLMNFESMEIMDVIYGRSKAALHSYFQRISLEEREKVEFLSTDMYEGFRFLQQNYLKRVKVCVDPFHVIQLILKMFDKQIMKIMNQFEKDSIEYYLLKNKRDLLLKNAYRVDWSYRSHNRKLGYSVSNFKLRELLLEINPLLKELYEIKEDYIQLNGSKSQEEARERLEAYILKCMHHSLPEVKRIGKTLSKWNKEIINSFTWFDNRRISNGPIESRNNIIKLIIRNAAGYHNFDHLRLRILYCINQK